MVLQVLVWEVQRARRRRTGQICRMLPVRGTQKTPRARRWPKRNSQQFIKHHGYLPREFCNDQETKCEQTTRVSANTTWRMICLWIHLGRNEQVSDCQFNLLYSIFIFSFFIFERTFMKLSSGSLHGAKYCEMNRGGEARAGFRKNPIEGRDKGWLRLVCRNQCPYLQEYKNHS